MSKMSGTIILMFTCLIKVHDESIYYVKGAVSEFGKTPSLIYSLVKQLVSLFR